MINKHNLGQKIIEVKWKGCNHEQLTTWYNNGDQINNFVGSVEVTQDFLNQDVPQQFPNSSIMIDQNNQDQIDDWDNLIVDQENTITKQMKWFTYAGKNSATELTKSINQGKYILWVGKRQLPYANRMNHVKSDQFYVWADYFGIQNILTKSESLAKLKVEHIDE